MLRRLMKAAGKDGYLFGGIKADKFGGRYKALTKRFAAPKAGKGFGDGDSHSIRRTVCTIFEDAEVPETIIARIVGHKIKSVSIDLYNGGPSLATKAKALKKLRYPR